MQVNNESCNPHIEFYVFGFMVVEVLKEGISIGLCNESNTGAHI